MPPRDAVARHTRRGAERRRTQGEAIGAVGLLARRSRVDERRVVDPARKGRIHAVDREILPPGHRRSRGGQVGAEPAGPLAIFGGQRTAEGAARRAVQVPGDEPATRPLDEPRHRGIAVRVCEMIHEQRSVGVRGVAIGKVRVRVGELVDAREAMLQRRAARQHAVLAADDASRARQPRFIRYRQPFGDPARMVAVHEEHRHATEHLLEQRPDSPHAIEMEDVHQLVGDEELQVVIGEAQRALGDRRVRIDHDAIRRGRHRKSIGVVDVVGDEDVDAAPRPRQVRRELDVRGLRLCRRPSCDVLELRGEVDVEVLGADRTPVLIRTNLGRGGHRRDEQEQRRENREPGRHGLERAARKKASSPSATAVA